MILGNFFVLVITGNKWTLYFRDRIQKRFPDTPIVVKLTLQLSEVALGNNIITTLTINVQNYQDREYNHDGGGLHLQTNC